MMDVSYVTARDLRIERVLVIEGTASLLDAARALVASDAGVIVVDTEPMREITDRTIVEALANGASLDTSVERVECPRSEFVALATPVDDLAAAMVVTGRQALVVIDDGRPLGAVRWTEVSAVLRGGRPWLAAFRTALESEEAG